MRRLNEGFLRPSAAEVSKAERAERASTRRALKALEQVVAERQVLLDQLVKAIRRGAFADHLVRYDR